MAAASPDLTAVGPPVFVSRETAASRCQISVDTWDLWVREGFAPQPALRRGGIIRWHWQEVEDRLANRRKTGAESDPFIQGIANAQAKVRRRAAA